MDYIRPQNELIENELTKKGLRYIREHLKPSRLEHTMRVREEAVRLARRFGADPEKADAAAVFHDIAKNMDAGEMNRMIREFGLDDKYIDQPNLAHSKLAACMMRRDFGIEDEDLLNAVASHTTGRAGMSLLEKVIFLADAIEPGRDYPSVAEIRRLAETDLDQACVRMLERTVDWLSQKQVHIDEQTLQALQYLRDKRDSDKEGRTESI